MYRQQFLPVVKVLNWLLWVATLVVLTSLIIEFGFYISPREKQWLHRLDLLVVWFFSFQVLVKMAVSRDIWQYLRSRWFDVLLMLLILVQTTFLVRVMGVSLLREYLGGESLIRLTQVYILVIQVLLVLTFVRQLVVINRQVAGFKLHPSKVLLSSFLFIILLGTGLLLLPRSVNSGHHLSWLDALFTATSATCVTGLVVVDTGSFFSTQGQLIILALIQIGGLGIMTYSSFFAYLLRRSVTLREQSLLGEILNVENLSLIRKMLAYTVLVTGLFEFLGALGLYFALGSSYGSSGTRLYSAIFHSISAFCNAGFSLHSDNFVAFQQHWAVMGILMSLIVVGGLGFPVLMNLSGIRLVPGPRHRRQITVHTRLVLLTTAILLGVGMAGFLALEWHGTLSNLPLGGKLMNALFQSVTARTAGFNTVDITVTSVPAVLLLLFLMFVGASPGSTGGGIKTTTFSLLFTMIGAYARGKERIELFRRTIPIETVHRAIVILAFSLMFTFLANLVLVTTEHFNFVDIMFEVFSAYGTVGLSRGITPHLSAIGKAVIIVCMFFGRLGALTIALALASPGKKPRYEYPMENVMVG